MKKLLNTLYVTTPDAYLALDGENVVVRLKDDEVGRVPLHNLENIVTFGWQGASPALMRRGFEKGVLDMSDCTSTSIGRVPSSAQVTAQPGASVPVRNIPDGSGISSMPRSPISNTPISFVEP